MVKPLEPHSDPTLWGWPVLFLCALDPFLVPILELHAMDIVSHRVLYRAVGHPYGTQILKTRLRYAHSDGQSLNL